jgi:hypothetical protein
VAFEGAWTLLHDDYSKEQDMGMPQEDYILWDGKTCALLFGVSERCESVKTQTTQGVLVKRAAAVDIALALKKVESLGHYSGTL